ncbi:helix-turn-helix transcriptional regulator, partial [Enterococcus sp. 2STP]|uniref:helix-turn-helix domain-containing protein n=2 Tax=unclassified Enterococcus TaxID=2608891 RepID=UPI0028FD15C1
FIICTQHISNSHMPKNIFLFIFVSLLLILPLFIGAVSPLSIFIATLAEDIYFIYLGFLTTKPIQQINLSAQHFLVKNKNFGITVILGATITLIGNVYNFFRWPISQNYFYFLHGYNINNDILSILLCFWLLNFFIQKIHVIPATIYNTQSFDKFCSEFTLTSRERELLAELLNSLTYQEIADKLYISNGTVKAHFHNIFIKTNTKNKHNLLQFYQKYTDKFS